MNSQWLVKSVKEALGMTHPERMSRAADSGFFPNTLYHGTSTSKYGGQIFDEFKLFEGEDLSRSVSRSPVGKLGVSLGESPEVADEFARMASPVGGEGAAILPVRFRGDKVASIDLEGSETNNEIYSTVADAWNQGFDAIQFRNYTTPSGEKGKSFVLVKDPKQVRSTNAGFDPAKKDSPNILASAAPIAAAGIGGAAILSPEESMANELPPEVDDRAAKLKRYYDLAKESGDEERQLKALKAMKELRDSTVSRVAEFQHPLAQEVAQGDGFMGDFGAGFKRGFTEIAGGAAQRMGELSESQQAARLKEFADKINSGEIPATPENIEKFDSMSNMLTKTREKLSGAAGVEGEMRQAFDETVDRSPVQAIGGNIAGQVAGVMTATPGGMASVPNTLAGRMGMSALGGAAAGALQPTIEDESVVKNAAIGGALGVAAPPVIEKAIAPAVAKGAGAAGNLIKRFTGEGSSSIQMAQQGLRSHDLSIGAAKTSKDLERKALSKGLPVPFEGDSALTKGQVTRNFEQLQFEKETAKLGEEGAPLRARIENQTETLISNLDAYADMSQPMRYELRDIGQSIDQALVGRRNRMQARINGLYERAREAGELRAPVEMATIPEMLGDIQRFEGVASNASAIRREALRLGAVIDQGGALVPGRMTVDDAELFRQFVNASTDIADPRESRIRRIAISAIDDATEIAGGDLYRQARSARSRMMTEFENTGITRRLLSTKKGTTERGVAYEDAFKKIFLDSPIEEINNVRASLLRAGDEGKQAWADLKARGISYIKENAQSASQLDSRGNPLLSTDKLNRAIESLDSKGKLSSIYGKRAAQAIRDLGDMSKYIYTAPPGAINHSNTASAIMVALDSLSTFAVTGVPAPVVSVIRGSAKYIKNVKLRKKINESLNYLSENPGSSSSAPRGS